jgi:hypothetical protein
VTQVFGYDGVTLFHAFVLLLFLEGFIGFAYYGIRRTREWTGLGWAITARNLTFTLLTVTLYLSIFGWVWGQPTTVRALELVAGVASLVSVALLYVPAGERHHQVSILKDRDFWLWCFVVIAIPPTILMLTIVLDRRYG